MQNKETGLPQQIVDTLAQYQEAEAMFIDAAVRAQWPAWFITLAEKSDGIFFRFLQLVIGRWAGLEVQRSQHNELETNTKGFRAGRGQRMICKSVTVTLYKHLNSCNVVKIAGGESTRPMCTDKCIYQRRDFALNLPLTGYGDSPIRTR